ncbi:hypothetical protein [Stenotrophomonas maltophilia]|uniref:hypothetical protein n=1 Tax=Stenotrophomonas maltophilia TaxID=40324 RepID=UPI001F535D48|nr:hypothetical protein [Stenotrophomonas maltophilia]MCI1057399.1 hypothetical protein [Stenotrophomonas maltophilia]MCI1061301.1 hypothetical protein [Stenotrophomonas maltophilia]MCI1077876.1 hypothetical protein [Stenotrophomonas maltophilia]MCI1082257.1 hypothetical protein [Stenotrophomonas maltophilia]MCI1094729.1 hypothetical protein [Stenotrophomonas maltophilia]
MTSQLEAEKSRAEKMGELVKTKVKDLTRLRKQLTKQRKLVSQLEKQQQKQKQINEALALADAFRAGDNDRARELVNAIRGQGSASLAPTSHIHCNPSS